MKISAKEWVLFILIAVLCFGIWYKFEYPHLCFIDLSVDRKEALSKAETYLNYLGVNPKRYLKAAVFTTDDWADRYLQKTIGLKAEEEFIKEHGFELFCWRVRFFKELQKEEYIFKVSPASGQILSFSHLIEDIEFREISEKDVARQKAEEFLRKVFGLNLKEYEFHEERIERYERRTDYSFSWEKKGVYIPWKKEEGGAKLLIGATISGNEIREFYRSALDIPEKFQRYIANQLSFGEYLHSYYFMAFIILIICSISIVIKRKHTLAVRLCKKWYIYLAVFFFVNYAVDVFNNAQNLIIACPTSVSLSLFIGNYLIKLLINIIFLSVIFIMPALAGESLHSETVNANKYSSFLHYIKSTFYSRSVTKSIMLGYLLFFITLGLQAAIFYFGQKYLGVWKEWLRLAQFSSAYLPFLSAFVIAANASLNEEVVFRLFGINLSKRYLKHTALAVVLTSLIWGFGHSRYAIFPVWFRGIELGLVGLLFGFIFIRYGLLPLIVAHYLFDVFLGVSAHIFGRSPIYLFSSSLLILAIPLAFAVVAYFMNKEEKEKEIKILLDPIQKYNLNILLVFISAKKSERLSAQEIREELIHYNWDAALVDLAIKEVFRI